MSFGPSPAVAGDLRIKALEVMVQSLQDRVTKLEGSAPRAPTHARSGANEAAKGEYFTEYAGCERIPRVAPRSSLLDASGNVIERSDRDVFADPPMWIKKGGASYRGKKFSQCPAEYLRDVASFAAWKAGKDHEQKVLAKNGKPKWVYDCYESSSAAGWAKLIEEFGTHDQTQPEQQLLPPQPELESQASDDFPF